MNPTEEFDQLLRTYGDMAYRMAYQLTGGRDSEAGELVQQLFIKIWKNWSQQRPSSMKGWMYRVLHNLYMDALRRRTRSKEIELPVDDIVSDGRLSLEGQSEQKELQREVSAALAKLDEDFRLPVVLCDMEGLPYEDIARILQCPVGTVRSRIHRGRAQLRQWLRLNSSEVCL